MTDPITVTTTGSNNGNAASPAVVERIPANDAPEEKQLVVQVPDDWTLGDLMKLTAPDTKPYELLTLLSECVVGGMEKYPLKDLRRIGDAVGAAVAEASNPNA